ncbi:uncharacterized protein LOC121382115 isoform X2 [Gigantopelta aegis]|nr:uncharacterized protein LOC121382115 isoform X2 [Gigantopelta aegis]
MDTSSSGGITLFSPHTIPPKRLTCWTGRQLLKPAVKDFSDHHFPTKRSLSTSSDEDSFNYSNHVSQTLLSDRKQILTCRPLETFRQSNPRSIWNTSGSPDNAEEIHRRHVQRSARLRSRLGYSRSLSANQLFTTQAPQIEPETPLCLQITRPGEGIGTKAEFQRRVFSARPANTGRYFDSTNGLRSRNGGHGRRPRTAGSWLTAGLNIQSIQLHSKMPLLSKRRTLQENLIDKHLHSDRSQQENELETCSSSNTSFQKNISIIDIGTSTDT